MKTKKVFIFDQMDTAESVAFVLSMHGYETIVSDNPRQAFRQIVTFQPDLVLAEYLDVDGEWLCQQLRQLKITRHIQIIMMSHRGPNIKLEDHQKLVLSCGANGYLPKPFNLRRVHEHVNAWLQH